jgi:hypothetical protein
VATDGLIPLTTGWQEVSYHFAIAAGQQLPFSPYFKGHFMLHCLALCEQHKDYFCRLAVFVFFNLIFGTW